MTLLLSSHSTVKYHSSFHLKYWSYFSGQYLLWLRVFKINNSAFFYWNGMIVLRLMSNLTIMSIHANTGSEIRFQISKTFLKIEGVKQKNIFWKHNFLKNIYSSTKIQNHCIQMTWIGNQLMYELWFWPWFTSMAVSEAIPAWSQWNF